MIWGGDAARKHAETSFDNLRGKLLPGPGLPGGGVPLPRGPQLERVRCVECAFQCGFLDMGIAPDITHQGVALPDTGSTGSPPTSGSA